MCAHCVLLLSSCRECHFRIVAVCVDESCIPPNSASIFLIRARRNTMNCGPRVHVSCCFPRLRRLLLLLLLGACVSCVAINKDIATAIARAEYDKLNRRLQVALCVSSMGVINAVLNHSLGKRPDKTKTRLAEIHVVVEGAPWF